jgi:hypothetical protein
MHRVSKFHSIMILTFALAMASSAQAQNPPAAAAPPEDKPSVLAVPKDYRYKAQGRRDPFVNPVPKPKDPAAAAAPSSTRPPGLKGVLVAEAQIAGVVTSKEPSMNVVIISAPGVKTPYFARVGDKLYDATVKSIKLDTVTFALNASAAEPQSRREIVRKVRPTPGENK